MNNQAQAPYDAVKYFGPTKFEMVKKIISIAHELGDRVEIAVLTSMGDSGIGHDGLQIPAHLYTKEGFVTLNLSGQAIAAYGAFEEGYLLSFSTRFGGKSFDCVVPTDVICGVKVNGEPIPAELLELVFIAIPKTELVKEEVAPPTPQRDKPTLLEGTDNVINMFGTPKQVH